MPAHHALAREGSLLTALCTSGTIRTIEGFLLAWQVPSGKSERPADKSPFGYTPWLRVAAALSFGLWPVNVQHWLDGTSLTLMVHHGNRLVHQESIFDPYISPPLRVHLLLPVLPVPKLTGPVGSSR